MIEVILVVYGLIAAVKFLIVFCVNYYIAPEDTRIPAEFDNGYERFAKTILALLWSTFWLPVAVFTNGNAMYDFTQGK